MGEGGGGWVGWGAQDPGVQLMSHTHTAIRSFLLFSQECTSIMRAEAMLQSLWHVWKPRAVLGATAASHPDMIAHLSWREDGVFVFIEMVRQEKITHPTAFTAWPLSRGSTEDKNKRWCSKLPKIHTNHHHHHHPDFHLDYKVAAAGSVQ